MTKVIKKSIENCWQCPYVIMYRCSATKNIPVIMDYKDSIPDWCPLESEEK